MVTARFLLDTNAVSEGARPNPSRAFLARFEQHRGSLAIAAPTWHELLFGVERLPLGRRRSAVEEYLATVIVGCMEILPYDDLAAAWHARERARLVAAGKTPPLMDSQIAAIAVRNQLVLVTNNLADFSPFSTLQLVDWTAGP